MSRHRSSDDDGSSNSSTTYPSHAPDPITAHLIGAIHIGPTDPKNSGACLRDSERLTVLAWQDLGRGLLLSENPHLRARFQIVHRRRDERRKVLAWRGRALSGYRLPSDDLGRGLLLSENPHLRARFQIVHRRRDERRKVLAWRGRALSGYRLPSDGSFTRPLTPAAATSFPHRTSTRRRLRHHRDATSPQPPGPQAPPRETID
ncbi:hypothetical protein MRX96_010946 [Rhipicephalus microplus]